MSKRILVVDDDREIVRLVSSYLQQAGYEVVTAYEGRTAVQTIRRDQPDLVVLDLMLPDMDGWDITRSVRSDSRLKATPIIMLTARIDDSDKIVGLELGADDYVTKPFNPRELVARVRSQLRRVELESGRGEEHSGVLLQRGLRLDIGRREVSVNGRAVDLTPSEFDILRCLLENAGYAFTRDELIERALGYEYAGLGRTLDSHIKNLRKKVEPDPKTPEYIQTVYGIGYRLNDE